MNSSEENICGQSICGGAGDQPQQQRQQQQQQQQKERRHSTSDLDDTIFRIITVIIYLITVSGPAVLLSVYYTLLWESNTLDIEVEMNNATSSKAMSLISSSSSSNTT